MLTVHDVSFPAFVVFELVLRHDNGEKQYQFKKDMPDGRTLVVVPDIRTFTPLSGVRIPVTPKNVIYEGPKFVIATCFVPEKYSLPYKVKEELFAKASHAEKPKPKPAPKQMTGRFLDGEKPAMDPEEAKRKLAGPNVLRSIADIPKPSAAISKKEKAKKGKKDDKKQARKHLMRATA